MFRKNIYHKTTEFYICVNLVTVTGKVPQIMAKKQNSIKNSTKTRSSQLYSGHCKGPPALAKVK